MDQSIEESMHITLSYFDEVIGPILFTVSPRLENPISRNIVNLLPTLMDIQDETMRKEPFLFSNPYFMSYNLMFNIPRSHARGGNDEFMISLVKTPTDTTGLVILSGLKDLLPSIRDSITKELRDMHDREIKKEVERIFDGFLTPVKVYLETQYEFWGKGRFSLHDF